MKKNIADRKAGRPDPINIHVGARVRARRLMLNLSQSELAHRVGLTFQQIQKYEHGSNRISVSRLIDISRALDAPIDYFLDECETLAKARDTAGKMVTKAAEEIQKKDLMMKIDSLQLIRAYSQIESPAMKKQLLEMARVMADKDNG